MTETITLKILQNLDTGFGISTNLIYYNNFQKSPDVILCKSSKIEIYDKLIEMGFHKIYGIDYIKGYDEKTDNSKFRFILIHHIKQVIIKLETESYSNYDDVDSYQVYLYHSPDSEINEILDVIKEHFYYYGKLEEPKVFLIKRTKNHLETTRLELPNQKIDVEGYYNDDFQPIYQKIVERLSTNDSKGLVLLHGVIGSGKSSLIKHLTKVVTDKKFIFIPSYMSNVIVNPDFTDFLMEHKNSILVLEDAESILMSRNASLGSEQAVSNILNLTDGILADGLSIQIVATFNTDLQNLDAALLRKGRLIAKYEFKELSADKCNKIFEDNDVDYETYVPMTLADVFNVDDKIGHVEKVIKNQIGFNRS